MTNIIEVENKIITLREQQVIVDADVAELYGVQTKRINEAVANNPEKFPDGYVIQLDDQEFADLRSKISTTNYQMTRQRPKLHQPPPRLSLFSVFLPRINPLPPAPV